MPLSSHISHIVSPAGGRLAKQQLGP